MKQPAYDYLREIESIKNQIISKYKPKKIILFGSAVSGIWTKDSDLDFLVIKDNVSASGIDRTFELEKLIEKKIAADFIVCKTEEISERLKMGDPFLKSLFAEGKVLYG